MRKQNLNIIIKFDGVTVENSQIHSPNWPQRPNYLYIILVVGGSGSKRNK